MEFIAILAGVAASIIGGLVTVLLGLIAQRRSQQAAPTFEQRISTLTNSLEAAASIISEAEEEITERREVLSRLSADIERSERLKEMQPEQVEVIAEMLQAEVSRDRRKSLITSGAITFGVALLFFLLGYAISFLT